MASRTRLHTRLTALEERFVAEYLIDLNATQAYVRACVRNASERSAAVLGSRLLAKDHVQRAVQQGQQQRLAKAELSAVRVLEELGRLAFLDPARFFDTKTGQLRPIPVMPENVRACISSFEVVRGNLDKTDGKRSPETLHKIKLTSKEKALELLCRHFKLLQDTVEVTGNWDKLVERLKSARRRGEEDETTPAKGKK
jgi:phage terminase small subunit